MSRGTPTLLLLTALVGWACCAAATGLRTSSSDQGVDARLLLRQEEVTLGPDGTRARRVHERTAVLTEWAVDMLGDPRVVHTVQGLEVLRAETTMSDGTVVAIKDNSVNETTPDALATAPAYADLRETVITHVGVERGCTNDLEYRVVGPTSPAPAWGAVPLHRPQPTERLEVRVNAPPGVPLRWSCLGCEAKPAAESTPAGQRLLFTWTGLPGLNTKEVRGHGRHPRAGQPRLVWSTAASWQALSDDLGGRFAAAARPTAGIRTRAASLTERALTPWQRVRAVWRFVAKDLATVDWPLEDLGHAVAPAPVVLERSYGHALDKAALLVALLGALDVRAEAVLVSRDTRLATDVPALVQLTDVAVVASVEGGQRWLSPHALWPGDGRAHLEGRWGLRLGAAAPARIEAGSDAGSATVAARLALKAEGALTGDLDVTLAGTYNPFVEVDDDNGGGDLAEGLLGGLSAGSWKTDCKDCGARVRRLGPDGAAFSWRASSQAAGEGRVVEVPLPWAPRSLLLAAGLHRQVRALPHALRSRGVERSVVELTFPSDLALAAKPPGGTLENAAGSLVTTSRTEDGKVVLERTLRLAKRVVAPADYPALRALAAELARRETRALLFVRKRPTAGDRSGR